MFVKTSSLQTKARLDGFVPLSPPPFCKSKCEARTVSCFCFGRDRTVASAAFGGLLLSRYLFHTPHVSSSPAENEQTASTAFFFEIQNGKCTRNWDNFGTLLVCQSMCSTSAYGPLQKERRSHGGEAKGSLISRKDAKKIAPPAFCSVGEMSSKAERSSKKLR